MTDVAIEEVSGVLSDHYDPRARKVRHSASTFRERSLAAMAALQLVRLVLLRRGRD